MYRSNTYEADETNSALDLSHQIPAPLISRNQTFQSTTSQPRKRKHDEIAGRDNIGDSFQIQASPGSLSESSLTLVPRLLVPRSCLPLAFLDVNGTPGDLQGNRIFSAKISLLEANLSLKKHPAGPVVLIAESVVTPCLYAVEQVQPGIYALCQLCAWVTLKDLDELIFKSKTQPNLRSLEKAILPGDRWWHEITVQGDGAVQNSQSKPRKPWAAEGFQLCLKAPMRQNPLAASPEGTMCKAQQKQALAISENIVQDMPLQETTQTTDEIFNMVRIQYQEALYMSQTSLAYYAKGPLSRARAFFQGNNISSSDRCRLPEFLRSCILNLPVMDKKYGETLPTLVKELPMAALSDDENGAVIEALRKKPRKSKKCTIGRNGLYPEEELNIAKWWISRKTVTDVQDTTTHGEEFIKARVLLQRAREIQLQIILILETLAIEISTSEIKLESISAQAPGEDPQDSTQKQKSKKPKDLNILLDLLVDRLCIWQSMNADEAESSPSGKSAEPQKRSSRTDQSSRLNSLRAFYIDVVLPFYGARLPSLCNMLGQKLAGSNQHSPARPPLVKAATSSALLRPGSTLQRQPMQKSRRTLERVLTDERTASRRPTPSLSRSATDSILPGLKREGSSVSLYSIPPTKVDVQKSRRYSQREVDLSAVTQAHEAKLKKKAKIDKELQGAIAALKKPNPRMAVKEFVEAAERRSAASNLRKPKLPGRNLSVQGVQVMATPSVNRRKDVFGGRSGLSHTFNAVPEPDEIPVSSAIRAVSCTPRASDCATNRLGRPLSAAHEQTPSRGPLKLIDSRSSLSSAANQPEFSCRPSGILSDARDVTHLLKKTDTKHLQPFPSSTFFRTPTKVRSNNPQPNNSHWRIEDTPIKALHDPVGTMQKKSISPDGVNENSISIYDSLGWNDDIDELS